MYKEFSPNDIAEALVEKKQVEVKVLGQWRPLGYAMMFSSVIERCKEGTIRIKMGV